jgi:hypothetical protein
VLRVAGIAIDKDREGKQRERMIHLYRLTGAGAPA